jgi:hypothetical protein
MACMQIVQLGTSHLLRPKWGQRLAKSAIRLPLSMLSP